MKKRIFRYVKHLVATVLVLGAAGVLFGLYHGASLHYGESPLMMNWQKDGPYVFYQNDSLVTVNYIKGNQHQGFYLDTETHPAKTAIPASCFFPLDSTGFDFSITPDPARPACIYNDTGRVLAISDIESGYRTFRDFLISNKVIDQGLNWIFGNGHLVLLGDFMDRDHSTTQVLWFIYKLEQDAKAKGGVVHFILGNHELKNMQGNYESTSPKYFHIAAILKRKQTDLYGPDSFLGRWLASKNAIEMINGTLFTHGGLHPELAGHKLSLEEVNSIVSNAYYKPFYPQPEKSIDQLLNSSHTGIAWYRGYFKDGLSQEEVELGIARFNAHTIVVGHTLQSKVKSLFGGKVIGIDVKHPKDYHKNFPDKRSEGLLIDEGQYFRVLANGKKMIL